MRQFQKKTDVQIIIVSALLSVTAFAFYKSNAAKVKLAESIRAKKATVMLCVPGGLSDTGDYFSKPKKDKSRNHNNTNNDKRPQENGNGCSHQLGTTAICDIRGSKRRWFNVPAC